MLWDAVGDTVWVLCQLARSATNLDKTKDIVRTNNTMQRFDKSRPMEGQFDSMESFSAAHTGIPRKRTDSEAETNCERKAS
jgi:hypothetical protein